MRRLTPWALRIVGFVVVVAIMGGLSQAVGLKYWMPRINDRSLNVFLYQKMEIAPDVLIVGSSKTLRGLIPEVIDTELSSGLGRPVTTYTVGQLGASCFANSMVLRDVLASNRRPEVVVFEASPGSLNANHDNVPDAFRYYASFADLIRSTPWLTNGARINGAVTGQFRGFANFALYGHHAAFPHGLTTGLERLLERRGRTYGTTTTDSEDRLSDFAPEKRRRMLDQIPSLIQIRHMDRYRIGGAPKAGFLRSCRLAQTHGVKLVVVNPPVTDDYRRLMYSDSATQEYLRFLSEAENAEDFEFHDLDRGVPRFTEADFIDFGHLNNDGARTLSQYVAKEILLPTMRE